METMTNIVFGTATIAVTMAVLYIASMMVVTTPIGERISEKLYDVLQYINEKSFAGFFIFAAIFAVVAFVTMVLEIIYKFI